MEELRTLYSEVKGKIRERIEDFKECEDTERYFEELTFCLFTPQSKAKSCWESVKGLKESGLLKDGCSDEISDEINKVRFRNNKARYLVEARDKFGCDGKAIKAKIDKMESIEKTREWLVQNVKGLGYKEASHYLRNIGLGEDLAILDRHILRNLEKFDVIEEVPANLTPSKYLEIEDKMKQFSKEIGIPLNHLDLLLWYKETGEIFK